MTLHKPRRATSQDVARHAGVSRALVSGVLNGTMSTMRVSPTTRQRVLLAATELGYSPNPVARALRQQRSNVIGYVPRSSRRTPYEHPVPFILGLHIARAAMRRQLHVVEASAETAAARKSDELVRFMRERRVDGVILDSPESAAEVQRFIDDGLPVIQLIRPRSDVDSPTVVVDADPGISEALRHLIELGHRDIAFIGHGGAHPVDRARLDCFTSNLHARGLPVRTDWLRLVADYDIAAGNTAMSTLLALPEEGPTALLATGDNLAVGVLQALYAADVRVPRDLSLISYDDIFAAHLAPPLTSVAQPLEEVAERALALLTAALEPTPDAGAMSAIVSLPTRLTVRDSTRSPCMRQEG
ncbi:MAG: LacI family transcriptional regulator [Gemmatimonadota bacterium]|nr:LacI family transcriptional regulator [Gemmatimonadota bacterium]